MIKLDIFQKQDPNREIGGDTCAARAPPKSKRVTDGTHTSSFPSHLFLWGEQARNRGFWGYLCPC